MTTWEAFRTNLTTVLGDDNRDEPTWSDEELLAYMNFALRAVADHTADEKGVVTVIDEATTSFSLPADLLALGPVTLEVDGRVKMLTPARRPAPASVPAHPVSIPASTSAPDTFYRWQRELRFAVPLPAGAILSVDYYGYWDRLAEDEDELDVPAWMEEALHWAMLMRCMSKPGLQAATIRPWNTRQDSGSPEDNPPMIYAEYCRKQYERILSEHARQDRGGWEAR
jgi:hypothetical protein